jgi:regulator of RNase E activity RraA
MQPWGVNEVISCGGVVVRPGDVIVGDDDGVVVVPSTMCERVLEIAAEREEIERVIKLELRKNPGSPGKYYPFNQNTKKLFEDYKSRGEA